MLSLVSSLVSKAHVYQCHTLTHSPCQAKHMCINITHRYTLPGEQITCVSASHTDTLTLPGEHVTCVSTSHTDTLSLASKAHAYQHHTPTHSPIFILLSSFHFHSQQCLMLMQYLHKGSRRGIQPTRNIHFGDSANHICSFWGFHQTETFILGIQPTRNIHFWGFSQPETFIFGIQPTRKIHF